MACNIINWPASTNTTFSFCVSSKSVSLSVCPLFAHSSSISFLKLVDLCFDEAGLLFPTGAHYLLLKLVTLTCISFKRPWERLHCCSANDAMLYMHKQNINTQTMSKILCFWLIELFLLLSLLIINISLALVHRIESFGSFYDAFWLL